MTTTPKHVQFDPAAILESLRGRLRAFVDQTGRSWESIAQETGIDHDALTALLTKNGEPISIEDMAEIIVACDASTDEVGELFA